MAELKEYLNPFKLSIYILYFFLITLEIISCECPENQPILKNNACSFSYCTESEFNSNYCSINNTKIKTQWLTNIIIFGDMNARFINFASFSNGDFVVEATPCKLIKAIRFFFGLKNNGRDLFKINNKETPFYSFEILNENNSGKKYQGEIQIATMNQENNKEYLLSLSKAESYAELYDFENGEMYKKYIIDIVGVSQQNERQISLAIKSSDGIYYSIYGFIYESQLYLYKFSLNTKNSLESIPNIQPTKRSNARGNNISCFETKNKRIVCFYYADYSNDNNGKPFIYVMSHDFNKIANTVINFEGYFDESSFIKCIHLYNESGVFSFYDNNNGKTYPFVYFIKIKDDGGIENEFPNLRLKYILNYAILENKSLMNDIIKISNTKICYTATDKENNEIIYIIVFHIISKEKIKIRYYSFPIFQLRNYKILSDMKSYSYNQFVAIGASVCNQSPCNDDHADYPHYSSLIIFSYPNSTDIDFDISEELLNDNEKTIENIEIDLKRYVKIENNIFGYIFNGIQMSNMVCIYNNIELFSTKNSLNIKSNYTLGKDENIKILFKNNNYLIDHCHFEYNLIIIEPDRDNYDSYSTHIDLYNEDESEGEFDSMKTPLIGRTSYFNIILKYNLIKNCSDINCGLCLESSSNICITCKSNSYFDLIDGSKKKKM